MTTPLTRARWCCSAVTQADRIRRLGQTRLTSWLRNRHVRGSADVAARAIAAASAQTVVLPGEELTASIITELAGAVLALDERVKTLDAPIEQNFTEHPQAAVIRSMPGFGPFLGASLMVGAGDLRAFPGAGHLAEQPGSCPSRTTPAGDTSRIRLPLASTGCCDSPKPGPRNPL